MDRVFGDHPGPAFNPKLNLNMWAEVDQDTKGYREVTSMNSIRSSVMEYLSDYNIVSSPQLDLVLFDYAIEHLIRICRLLRQPYGHALLIGLPGSGRGSLTKLATYMCEYNLFMVR